MFLHEKIKCVSAFTYFRNVPHMHPFQFDAYMSQRVAGSKNIFS